MNEEAVKNDIKYLTDLLCGIKETLGCCEFNNEALCTDCEIYKIEKRNLYD